MIKQTVLSFKLEIIDDLFASHTRPALLSGFSVDPGLSRGVDKTLFGGRSETG